MSTSTAILLGSAMIAVSVFVAIGRQQPQPQPQPQLPAPVVAPAPAPVVAPTPAPVVVTPRATVVEQAGEAMKYQMTMLRTRCPAGPGVHRFVFNVTFDAAGVEVVHGISEDPRNTPSQLASCLSGALAPLRIPPPGAVTAVELPVELP